MALEVTIRKITSWYDNKTLWEGEAVDIRDAVEKANLVRANLVGANLDGANLVRANLVGANLVRANLVGANLVRANLVGANLDGANLVRANLDGANLVRANLDGANLVRANLVRANLDGANLDGANLVRANLVGANLDGANLVRANLVGAKMSNETRLESGETWKQYLEETVPALLVAGGQPLESFGEHFVCHTWENCPMAHAFKASDIGGVPILLRPRADQFIKFFDAKLIPWPLSGAAAAQTPAEEVKG